MAHVCGMAALSVNADHGRTKFVHACKSSTYSLPEKKSYGMGKKGLDSGYACNYIYSRNAHTNCPAHERAHTGCTRPPYRAVAGVYCFARTGAHEAPHLCGCDRARAGARGGAVGAHLYTASARPARDGGGMSTPHLPVTASNGIGESRSLWLPVPEAARYVGKSIAGFRRWKARRRLVPNGLGQFARRDLDKAMAVPRKRHAMAEASLANLRRQAG